MSTFEETVQEELGSLVLQLLKANHANKSLAARVQELEAEAKHPLAKESPPVKKEKEKLQENSELKAKLGTGN